MVMPRFYPDRPHQKSVGFFLQCNAESDSTYGPLPDFWKRKNKSQGESLLTVQYFNQNRVFSVQVMVVSRTGHVEDH